MADETSAGLQGFYGLRQLPVYAQRCNLYQEKAKLCFQKDIMRATFLLEPIGEYAYSLQVFYCFTMGSASALWSDSTRNRYKGG